MKNLSEELQQLYVYYFLLFQSPVMQFNCYSEEKLGII